jgi:hypothetical protein
VRHRHSHHHPRRALSGQSQPDPSRPGSYVAPREIIREDFQRMLFTKRLRTTEAARELILMQSVEGHAQMGHGVFAGRRFPNTEMEDIVEALGRSPHIVGAQRQDLIDEISRWVEAALGGAVGDTLVNEDGDGLVGCGVLRHFGIVPSDVLRGLYLGGLRDASEVRLEVEQRTGQQIGGGRCCFVDVEVMHRMGLDGEKLARGSHADQIESYRRAGLVVDDPGPGARHDHIRYMYIRDRVGGGASDDSAILAGGKLYNLSVALGVFLADAIDTLEKFVVNYADQDYDLALHIGERAPKVAVSKDELYRLIWVSCPAPEEAERIPDSSLRHMIEIDPHTDQTALESHLAWLSDHRFSPMLLGSEDVPNGEFYEWFESRLKACPI